MRLGLGISIVDLHGMQSAARSALLALGGVGLAVVAGDDSAAIIDPGTPANNFQGRPADILAVARASQATAWNSAHQIETIANNVLRRDFDPRLAGACGYLIEGQRSNIFPWSSDLGSWTNGNSAETLNSVIAPNGALEGDTLAASSDGIFRYIYRLIGLSQSTNYVYSQFLKYNNCQWAWLLGETSGDRLAAVDIQNGALGTIASGLTALLLPGGDNWHRGSIAFTKTTPNASEQVGFGVASTNTVINPPAVSGQAAYGWGAQLEPATFPSSHIPTGAVAAAREADAVTLPTSQFPWSGTAGTLLLEAHTPLGPGMQVLWQCDDGSENNRLRVHRNSSNEIHFIATVSGSDVCDLNLGSVANDTPCKLAVSWAANDFVGSLSGATAVSDTAGALPTVDKMRLGSSFTGEHFFGHVKKCVVLPLDKSAAEVEALAG